MSLQTLMTYAQNMKIDRSDVVAQSVSRSGKVYTEKRSSVKPFRITFTPPEYLPWTTKNRLIVEDVLAKDRHTPHTTRLGFSLGSQWMADYLGNKDVYTWDILQTENNPNPTGRLAGLTFNSESGNVLTLNTTGGVVDNIVLEAGDIIQPEGYPYPFVVVRNSAGVSTYKKTGSTLAVTVHRPYMPHYPVVNGVRSTTPFNIANKAVIAGGFCTYNMIVTTLPSINYVPGKFIQFSGEFVLLEQVEAY
jgi:hypothetical protein